MHVGAQVTARHACVVCANGSWLAAHVIARVLRCAAPPPIHAVRSVPHNIKKHVHVLRVIDRAALRYVEEEFGRHGRLEAVTAIRGSAPSDGYVGWWLRSQSAADSALEALHSAFQRICEEASTAAVTVSRVDKLEFAEALLGIAAESPCRVFDVLLRQERLKDYFALGRCCMAFAMSVLSTVVGAREGAVGVAVRGSVWSLVVSWLGRCYVGSVISTILPPVLPVHPSVRVCVCVCMHGRDPRQRSVCTHVNVARFFCSRVCLWPCPEARRSVSTHVSGTCYVPLSY